MAVAQPNGKRRRMCTMDDELFELLIRLMVVAEFAHKSATSGGPGSPAFVLALYEPAGEAGRKVAVRSGDGGDAAGYLGAG